MAAQGYTSRESADDFERCLQLGGTDLRDDELFATLIAVYGYYIPRADVRRLAQVLEVAGKGLKQGRQWFRSTIEGLFGVVSFLRGEFATAASQLEKRTAGQASADQQRIDAVWFLPTDAVAGAHLHLALVRLVCGDLAGAESALTQAAHRAEQIGFPQGPFSLANTRTMQVWLNIEAGRLDRAAEFATDLISTAERHDLDMWPLYGAIWQAIIGGLVSVGADDVDPTVLLAHIETLTKLLETLRTRGLKTYITHLDGLLARLLLAAGQPEQARARLETALALAEDTGMHFCDAELLRLRARTHTDADACHADISAALELARRQGAALFELRAALDDFELRGDVARAALAMALGRMPRESTMPEVASARTAL